MTFYSMTLRHPDDENLPLPSPPVAERLQFVSVPPAIVSLFEGADHQGVTLDNAVLTFSDGTQVLWGTMD